VVHGSSGSSRAGLVAQGWQSELTNNGAPRQRSFGEGERSRALSPRANAIGVFASAARYALKPPFFQEFSSQADTFCCVELRTC
jgi:hypothetical protein